ncbi:Lrp/AsnC family transcriptional regulator [Bradyrhizobium sp.]|jgi:Lrp/AsnC family leucine-responsive transcriptional regulator|uniref:Lrp/AsnC family transcriptional regulator n=1 Tax=Bradyrhizobium sp. TaxID=376 RepID=UPI002C9487A9|nr:Lrp/AsnC family transcriptional regulator [Bradyrhizobium sp.]HWX62681.1 Lrp/AsnC family transcriptional regulator [Bradyrhizobium sp.]
MQKDAIDHQDRAILRELMRDGRLTNVELAERVNLSASACLRRVRAMEEAGLIAGYVMLLNTKLANIAGVAFVSVTLRDQGRATLDRFETASLRHPEIAECYLIAGSADYLLRVAYRDAADFERIHTKVLTQLPGVLRVQSTLTLRTVKHTTALPV